MVCAKLIKSITEEMVLIKIINFQIFLNVMAMIHTVFATFLRAAWRTKYLDLGNSEIKSSSATPSPGRGACYTVSLLLIGKALLPACSLAEAAVGVAVGLSVHFLYRRLYTLVSSAGESCSTKNKKGYSST